MKSRGLVDLYLPSNIAYHVKILLGSVLAAAFLSIVQGMNPLKSLSPWVLLMIFLQFEIYIYLGFRFFNIRKAASTGEFLRKMILRLGIYYLIVLVIALLFLVLTVFILYIVNGADLHNFFPNLIRRETKGFFVGFAGGIFFGTMIFFFFQWIDALKRVQKLKEEQLIFRYETLKNQVRPHFLFNSLNTLSSLVDGNEPAEKFIERLSGMYRYMLDNLEKNEVDLADELKFVGDYFYLQQIRDEEKIELDMTGIPVNTYNILPFSMQIPVENALKHNMATRETPLKIRIFFEDDQVIIINNLRKKMNLESSTGIGLKNLKERIRLATGKELKVSEGNSEFSVTIPLIKKVK